MRRRGLSKRTWILLLGALAFFAWIYGPGLAKIIDLARQESDVAREVRRLEEENKTLSERIEGLKNDPLAVEQEARRKLGLSRSKEIVYKIIDQNELRREQIE